MELNSLKGIGPARLKSFRAVGISSLRDLLYFFPVRYEDHLNCRTVSEAVAGGCMLEGMICEKPKVSYFHGMSRVTARLQDATGKIATVWFNQPWVIHQLPVEQKILLYGNIQIKNGTRSFVNPRLISRRELAPVYKKIAGIPGKMLQEMIRDQLEHVNEIIQETLPESLRRRYDLIPLGEAIQLIHFPGNDRNLGKARRRLDFEKMLIYLTAVAQFRSRPQDGWTLNFRAEDVNDYWQSLHFLPTNAQRRVLLEIASDMKKNQPMARLIQGDVGCGKTAIAFGAIFLACRSGFQCAMMAPTEILARQHYQNALTTLAPFGIHCALLTGHTKASDRKKILKEIKSGECQAVFGTHALISSGVDYKKLGLVITDEQHRFGVRQRTALQDKGALKNIPAVDPEHAEALTEKRVPHVLVMSATPIPRTLALILYGDLDLSLVDELPPGRKTVKTRIVPEAKRDGMYAFLKNLCLQGEQGYVVCPLANESESLDNIRDAQTLYSELNSGALKGLRLGRTWGMQRNEEKLETMKDFSEGNLDVLVATTVIEVGVNVPNATVMIIENAERYGLSQLHQLRGRVGRGDKESWCFLCTEFPDKLKILCETSDGFEVAQKDLEQRGPGDLLGTRQSGEPGSQMLGLKNLELLNEALQCSRELAENPALDQEREQVENLTKAFFQDHSLQVGIN